MTSDQSAEISAKVDFNTVKTASMYFVLTKRKLRPDMHWAFMVNGHNTKYE